MKAVGLLGGAFDPVHCGHLALAQEACEHIGLAEVIFIPSASPPHKSERDITPFRRRVDMLRLAIAGESRFHVSELEWYIPPPSYTIDMLSSLPGEKESGRSYYFLIGSDAFCELTTWKKYRLVLERIHFVVAHRQGHEQWDLDAFVRSLGYLWKKNHWYNEKTAKKVYYLDVKIPEISSTHIRKTVGTDDLPSQYIPSSVCEYIQEHRLYTLQE